LKTEVSRVFFLFVVFCSDLIQRGCVVWEFEIRGFEIVLYENIKSQFMHKIWNHASEKLRIIKNRQSSFQINGETALPNGVPVTSPIPSR